MSGNVPVLQLRSVVTRQGMPPHFAGLSADFVAGALHVVLGAPGAGKTLLIALLAGQRRPRSGHILRNGQDITGRPAHRRGFAVVSPDDFLFPNRDLVANLALPLRLRGMRAALRRPFVAAALEAWRIAPWAASRPAALPLSVRRRALLGRAALAAEAGGVLLLDDPACGLEGAERASLLEDLRLWQRRHGCLVVLTARDPADALLLADNVLLLQSGVKLQSGPPMQLYDQPASPAAAALMGAVNILPGLVHAMEDDIADIALADGPIVSARLAAPQAAGLQPGDRCVVCVRPERIALANIAARDMGEGALEATILHLHSLGDRLRLDLRLVGGVEIRVLRPAAFGMLGLAPGQNVALAWQPYQALAFAQPPEMAAA